MRLPSIVRSSALALALLGGSLSSGCVEETGAAGDYCQENSQCDEGLICVELVCRDPFGELEDVDSGPVEEDMFVPPDLGPDEDMGPEEMDMGPEEMDMGPEGDMGPEEMDMGPEEMDMGPEEMDMGPEGDMG